MNYGVNITSTTGGNVGYGAPITISGTYGSFLQFGGTIKTLALDVDFGQEGDSVHLDLTISPPGHSGIWQATGTPSPNVRGTQSFAVTVRISGTYVQPPDQPQPTGLDPVTDRVTFTVLDVLPPSLTINGFPDNVQASIVSSTFPVAYTLSGTVSDPDSNISQVQVALNNGPVQLAVNNSGTWSQWSFPCSLPAGLHCFAIYATDVSGHQAQGIRFLSISPPPVTPPPTPTASITSWTRL